MSLSGSKKSNVDEATLVAESWEELAYESSGFSPYREYQLAKQAGKAKHEVKATGRDKPAKYRTISPSVVDAPQPTPVSAVRIEDSETTGSFNPHHRQSIKKHR